MIQVSKNSRESGLGAQYACGQEGAGANFPLKTSFDLPLKHLLTAKIAALRANGNFAPGLKN